MTSCTIDFFSDNPLHRYHPIVYAIFAYWIPLSTIVYHYAFIVKTVFQHERALAAQVGDDLKDFSYL